MKHSWIITLVLICMFLVSQLIGLAVTHAYSPEVKEVIEVNGTITNQTVYNLPYGTEPPSDITPRDSLFSIVLALVIAIAIMLILMKVRAEIILKTWFFIVITVALGITFNAPLMGLPHSSLIALAIALPLTYLKMFNRNIYIHNLTELFIYPGIAVIFIPLLNIFYVVLLLIIISLYDMYAVWHAGFMQKMARYQISTLKVFSGFFIPYLGKKERILLTKSKSSRKKVKMNIAILGGGDVVFPMIVAGIVAQEISFLSSFYILAGSTLSLAVLFFFSKKGKFYPAMPFLTLGCFLGLACVYLVPHLV